MHATSYNNILGDSPSLLKFCLTVVGGVAAILAVGFGLGWLAKTLLTP